MNTSPVRSVIFLGRKRHSVPAAEWLLAQGIAIRCIVTKEGQPEEPRLRAIAETNGIPFFTDDAPLYEMIEKRDERIADVDLVLSYLYWKKIREPLYRLPNLGCVNFHPAPLPDYKGRAGYNTAILDRRTDYGVSAHFIDSEEFDSGPIIKVLNFPMDPERETALSLERASQEKMLELFLWTMELFRRGEDIPKTANVGGTYLTMKQLEALSHIDLELDSPEEIRRKIRAFFFPPHHGAKITINGEHFTLVDESVLALIRELLSR